MAEAAKSEMYMKFVKKGTMKNRGVNAESAALVHPKDDLMKDFNPAPFDSYSDFFDVTKFEFGASIKDDDAAVGNMSKGAQTTSAHGGHSQVNANALSKNQKDKAKDTSEFKSWRSITTDKLKDIDYPLEVDQFSFTRQIDGVSPVFFEATCNSTTFDAAAFVRRLSPGTVVGSVDGKKNLPGKTFLRIDFQIVLITSMDWDDGEVLTETCKFICQKFQVKYMQQAPDGSFVGGIVPAHWDQVLNARRSK